MPQATEVNAMFGRIAPRYDLANRILSGGNDVRWRRRLVEEVARKNPSSVLDLATGSGDVAFALAAALPAATSLTGADFCAPMLAQAERRKKELSPPLDRVRFEEADALQLPYPDRSFDAVTIAFGLRNFADRARGLREMRRVLKPRGTLFVLEFSQPTSWFRPAYFLFMRRVAPTVGGWLTGDSAAYRYLCTSIKEFPDAPALAQELAAAGFSSVDFESMTFGSVALHRAAA